MPKLTNLNLEDLPPDAFLAAEIPTGSEHWYTYAIAYKEAADHLADLMRQETYPRNMFGAPMLFLYRHSIEVLLKSLLVDAGELLDEPQQIPREHYLKSLWVRVRKMILAVENSSGSEWVDRADQIIEQFDQRDPGSFAFRYPAKPDGTPSLPHSMLIDPRVVSHIVAELYMTLDGAANQIAEYKSIKWAMWADFGGP